jgi:hypothetical protein
MRHTKARQGTLSISNRQSSINKEICHLTRIEELSKTQRQREQGKRWKSKPKRAAKTSGKISFYKAPAD